MRRTLILTSAVAILNLAACSSLGSTTPGSLPGATPGSHTFTTPGAAAQAVIDWFNGGGQTELETLTTDTGAISAGAAKADPDALVAALAAACQQLTTDIPAAQAYAPIPDPQAQASWSSALTRLHQGAADCAAGAQSTDAAAMKKGTQEVSTGSSNLAATSQRIQTVKGGQ